MDHDYYQKVISVLANSKYDAIGTAVAKAVSIQIPLRLVSRLEYRETEKQLVCQELEHWTKIVAEFPELKRPTEHVAKSSLTSTGVTTVGSIYVFGADGAEWETDEYGLTWPKHTFFDAIVGNPGHQGGAG